ncbi:uncharacterized protein B0H64DRAFT_327289 [Chaetomium fimeti]|uniref:Uncharacterized protein n=1 Tax=Chaetomium fimeti TaxID=1854472 RepID=A0AAE0LQG5_9PEZI|nr:hypothetical protein B0H64DRAFT_327289 [Chaetomium fimeti]
MRSIWSCSSCAVVLIFALWGGNTSASHVGREWKDVHRVAKAQVTAHPARRDEGACPAEYTSCAAALNGGCCPSRYACGPDSCIATTAGPTTACGRVGFFACNPVNGEPGCCPLGSTCEEGFECRPSPGITFTNLECPSDYFLCPGSDGCCRNGLGCGPGISCYSTEPVTTTLTQTTTTTSGTEVVTEIQTTETVITPTIPSETVEDTGAALKFMPTSVPKFPASTPSSESDGGLSGGAIGGIIGGVVVLLIVVVVAAFLIIRRLKHVEDIMESKRGSSSGKKSQSQSQAQKEHYGRQLHSDMDDMSVDPLMVPPSTTATNNNSTSATPQPGGAASSRGRADSAGFTPSPNIFPDDRSRHASPDFSGGYFDVVPGQQHAAHNPAAASLQQQPMQAARIRGSTDSASTTQRRGYAYTHWRQQSNASELSADGSDNGGLGSPYFPPTAGTAGTGTGGGIPELDGSGGFVELPGAGAPTTTTTPGPAVPPHSGGVRSRSSSNTSIGAPRGHVRRRSDGVTSPGLGQGMGMGMGQADAGLEPLDEGAEIHGYYGRRDQQAGQTAAGLEGMGGQFGAEGGQGSPPQGPQGSQAGRG